ncbi:hypothetical protein E2C01_004790 [Portunus trituberculatus]|uniref:Uncharacterized protein n=1 Tax=Portunus trituberculatus TaxID=210409 RepID=A0A5B7CQY1_PORTR|nr:hypothetical protein [Portunus trituberculatus]
MVPERVSRRPESFERVASPGTQLERRVWPQKMEEIWYRKHDMVKQHRHDLKKPRIEEEEQHFFIIASQDSRGGSRSNGQRHNGVRGEGVVVPRPTTTALHPPPNLPPPPSFTLKRRSSSTCQLSPYHTLHRNEGPRPPPVHAPHRYILYLHAVCRLIYCSNFPSTLMPACRFSHTFPSDVS